MPPEMEDSTLISPPNQGTLWQFKLESVSVVNNSLKSEDELSVYPNPSSSGIFQIQTPHVIKHVTLHEIASGKKIPVNNHNNSSIHINQKGVYLLTVQTQNEIFRKKLVVVN